MLRRQLRRYRRPLLAAGLLAALATLAWLLGNPWSARPPQRQQQQQQQQQQELAELGPSDESLQQYCFSPTRHRRWFDAELRLLRPEPDSGVAGAVLLLRHGDRMPLFAERRLQPLYSRSCNLLPWLRRRLPASEFDELRRRIAELRPDYELAPGLQRHEFYSSSARCQLGQLTPIGFLQAFAIGDELRRSLLPLLRVERPSEQIAARTSVAPRAAQTLNALLYGLLRADLAGVRVAGSDDFRLCPGECGCALLPGLRRRVDRLAADLWRRHHRRLLDTFAGFFGRRLRASHLEYLLPLRCWANATDERLCLPAAAHGDGDGDGDEAEASSGSCVTEADVQQLWAAHADVGRRLRQLPEFRRLALALAHPLLVDVVDRLVRPGRRRLALLVGHDHTVQYLLQALGAWDGGWPRYAASVLFLLEPDDGFSLKYNGRDVTERLPFCSGRSPCAVSLLAEFVSSGAFAEFNVASYEALCDSDA